MKILFLPLLIALVLSGCANRTSDYLEEKPILFYLEESKSSAQLQEESAKAFLAALSRYRWEVRHYNSEEGIVVAEACRQGMHCAEITATIMADGSVSVIRSPGQVLSVNEGAMLKQWVGSLQRQYQKNMRSVR